MRPIAKRPPPHELTRYIRENPEGAFDSAPKQPMRDALVHEQGALCCYCMDRITASGEAMRIEHRVPRSSERGRTLQLEWTNLLGACQEKPGARAKEQTCDKHKADREISVDPTRLAAGEVAYDFHLGEVRSADPTTDYELRAVLNLNTPHLRAARREAVEALKAHLRRRYGDGSWTKGKLSTELATLRGAVRLTPFVGILEAWLEMALRHR